jgi:hypothetical protein
MNKRKAILIASSALALLAAISFIAMNIMGKFNVDTIEFSYNPKISEDKMFEILGIAKGKTNIFTVSTGSAEEKLKAYDDIKEVKVVKRFPGTLSLRINYNNIIGKIKYTNIYIVVNETGEAVRIDSKKGSMTVIEGMGIKHFKTGAVVETDDDELFSKILALIAISKESQVKSLDSVEVRGSYVFAAYDKSYKVDFGTLTDLEKSFNSFIAIYEDLKKKNLKGGVIHVGDSELPSWRPLEE